MTQSSREIAVSVVVPAYNRARLLKRLLDSLAAMDSPPAWEVIVVDDASTDDTGGTVEAWASAHSDVACRYVRQERNFGPGSARNRGTEEAQGRYVAFVDTDCVVAPAWLGRLHAALEEHGDAAGAGGPVEPFNPENVYALYNTVNCTLEPIVYGDNPIPYLITCNCAYRRDALLAVGGFTADLETPGGEDVAASIALYKQGRRFAYAEGALVYHDYQDTWRSFVRTWTNYGYGCGLITHRLLTPAELHPEWLQQDAAHYWGVQTVRPTVTGVRSFVKDLRWFWSRCAEQGAPVSRRPRLLLLRIVERLCYYRGWRRGVNRVRREAPH